MTPADDVMHFTSNKGCNQDEHKGRASIYSSLLSVDEGTEDVITTEKGAL